MTRWEIQMLTICVVGGAVVGASWALALVYALGGGLP